MSSIIIEAKNKKDLTLLKKLSEKMGLSAYFFNAEQEEDVNFREIIQQNDSAGNLNLEEAKVYYQKIKKNGSKV